MAEKEPFTLENPVVESPPFDLEARLEALKPSVLDCYKEVMRDPSAKARERLAAADSLAEIFGWKEKEAQTPVASFSFTFSPEALASARSVLDDAEGSQSRQLSSLPTNLEQRRTMQRGEEGRDE